MMGCQSDSANFHFLIIAMINDWFDSNGFRVVKAVGDDGFISLEWNLPNFMI